MKTLPETLPESISKVAFNRFLKSNPFITAVEK